MFDEENLLVVETLLNQVENDVNRKQGKLMKRQRKRGRLSLTRSRSRSRSKSRNGAAVGGGSGYGVWSGLVAGGGERPNYESNDAARRHSCKSNNSGVSLPAPPTANATTPATRKCLPGDDFQYEYEKVNGLDLDEVRSELEYEFQQQQQIKLEEELAETKFREVKE